MIPSFNPHHPHTFLIQTQKTHNNGLQITHGKIYAVYAPQLLVASEYCDGKYLLSHKKSLAG